MAKAAKKYPSRKVQLAKKKLTHIMCRAFGHKLEGTMKWGAKDGNVHYTGYSTEQAVCVRDEDGPCGYWRVTVYDGQMQKVAALSSSGYDKEYVIKGQGRGKYRIEGKLELLNRTG